MRILTRFSVLALALALATGPIAAAPLASSAPTYQPAATMPPAAVSRTLVALAIGGLAIGMAIKVKDNATIVRKFVG